MAIAVGDRVRIAKESHTFDGKPGTVRMIEPSIRAALFTDDLLHVELDSGHSIRIFAKYAMKNNSKRKGPKMKKQTGFTALELIIVIAVVGVIAAMAIPSFGIYLKRERFRDEVRDFALTFRKERIWAMKNMPVEIAIGPGGYTINRMGEPQMFKPWPGQMTNNLVSNKITIGGWGSLSASVDPALAAPDPPHELPPATFYFYGPIRLAVEVSIGGSRIVAF